MDQKNNNLDVLKYTEKSIVVYDPQKELVGLARQGGKWNRNLFDKREGESKTRCPGWYFKASELEKVNDIKSRYEAGELDLSGTVSENDSGDFTYRRFKVRKLKAGMKGTTETGVDVKLEKLASGGFQAKLLNEENQTKSLKTIYLVDGKWCIIQENKPTEIVF